MEVQQDFKDLLELFNSKRLTNPSFFRIPE